MERFRVRVMAEGNVETYEYTAQKEVDNLLERLKTLPQYKGCPYIIDKVVCIGSGKI